MNACSKNSRYTDKIQDCVSLSNDGISHEIWNSDNLTKPCGTLSVKALHGNIRYRINGSNAMLFTVPENETSVMTFDPLTRIQFVCDSVGLCKIEFCLLIHYECC